MLTALRTVGPLYRVLGGMCLGLKSTKPSDHEICIAGRWNTHENGKESV